MIDNTWSRLKKSQQERPSKSQPYTLLKLRAQHPGDSISELVSRYRTATGQDVREDTFRQQLRRARVRFAQLLVNEIKESLSNPCPEAIDNELMTLNLKPYVSDFPIREWMSNGDA